MVTWGRGAIGENKDVFYKHNKLNIPKKVRGSPTSYARQGQHAAGSTCYAQLSAEQSWQQENQDCARRGSPPPPLPE